MDLGIKDKIALISASSKGLGKEVALVLAMEGAKVTICSRNEDQLKITAEEISDIAHQKIDYHPCDLLIKEDRENLAQDIVQKHMSIDILVNNSGGPPGGIFTDFHEEDWINAFRLNFISTQSLIELSIPHMIKNRWGRIVNITSIAVKQPVEGLILSNGVRSAVIGMAKTLANELGQYQITVNNVCPGFTLTDRVKQLAQLNAKKRNTTPENVFKEWEMSIPMKRLGEPREFANLVAFLCSEGASYITGTSIQCDGGACKSLL